MSGHAAEQVEVDGVLRDKYVRQTRREIDEGTVREVYEDGFPEPKSKPFTYVDDEYVERAIRCSRISKKFRRRRNNLCALLQIALSTFQRTK